MDDAILAGLPLTADLPGAIQPNKWAAPYDASAKGGQALTGLLHSSLNFALYSVGVSPVSFLNNVVKCVTWL